MGQELSVRLKADGSGLVGEVRSGTAEIDKLGKSAQQTSAQMQALNAQQRTLLQTFREQTTGVKGNSDAIASLDDELAQFMSKLSPAYNAVRQLDTGHDLLNRSLAAGLLSQKGYDDALARLTAKYAPAASGAAALSGGHGALATNTAFATREVRALFDELSSGRDRQAIGTATLIATRTLGIGLAGIAAVVGVGALFGAFALGAVHAEQAARALNEVEGHFAATGRAGLVARDDVKGMIDQMVLLPGMSRSSAAATLAALSSIPTIGGPLFRNLAGIVDDFAHATGQQAPQAAKALGEAFADPAKGAQTLDRELQLLTADQLLHIQSLERQGHLMEAQQALYDALKGRIKGLAEEGLTPLQHATEGLGKSWDGFMERLGNSAPVQAAIAALTSLLNTLGQAEEKANTGLTGLAPGETYGGAYTGRAGHGQLGVRALPQAPSDIGADFGYDASAIAQRLAAQAAQQTADQATIKSALELGRSYEGLAGQERDLKDKAEALQKALALAISSDQPKAAAELRLALAGVGEQMRKLGADNLLVSLEQKLASLTPLTTEVDRVTRQLAQGTEKHTEANKTAIISIAAKIDAMEREKKEVAALAKINLEQAAAQDEQGKAAAEAYNQNMAGIVDYQSRARQLQIATITDTQTRLKAQADYEADLERQKLTMLQRNGVAAEMVEDTYTQYVSARQAKLAEDLKPQWQKMLDGWSNTTRAMRESYDSLQLGVQQAGEQIAVEFGRTGHLSGQALVFAFQDEVMKSAYRKYFAPAAAAGTDYIASLMPDVFGTRSTPTGQGALGSGDYSVPAPVKHAGGLAGEPGPTRALPSALFANAPRFHSGIGPGEVAAVIRKDEGVFTPGQMKAMGGPQNIKVELINQSSNKVAASDAQIRFDPDAMVVSVLLKDDARNGPISQMLTRRAGRAIRS